LKMCVAWRIHVWAGVCVWINFNCGTEWVNNMQVDLNMLVPHQDWAQSLLEVYRTIR
jgi:hypothetical protein